MSMDQLPLVTACTGHLSGNIRASRNKKRQDTWDLMIINTPPSPVIHVAT